MPIVISKNAIKDAIIMPGCANMMSNPEAWAKSFGDMSKLLSSFMIPMQLLKMSDRYLEPGRLLSQISTVPSKRYALIQYALLATQMTYEQDDYYNIFGKDSSIFEKISLIRNAIAHNCIVFTEQASRVDYTDRDRTFDEPISNSILYLASARKIKELIKEMGGRGHSQEAVRELKDKLAECMELILEHIGEASNASESQI